MGSVTAASAGSLIGNLRYESDVSQSYGTGTISASISNNLGGFAGYYWDGTAVFASSYWDTTTTGVTDLSDGVGNIPNEPGVTGLNDRNLTSALPAGFDPAVWGRKKTINGGLPYLLANPPH